MVPPDRIRGELSFEFIRPPDRRFTFHSVLLDATDEHIVLAHQTTPSKPLVYKGEEVMAAGYTAVWFLYKGRPYDVGRFYRPDGTWTGYYADILEPVNWEGSDPSTLQPIVDLFLDLWIAPDGTHLVLDEDEFEDAITNEYLSSDQIAHARSTLDELVAMTAAGTFPPEEVKLFRL